MSAGKIKPEIKVPSQTPGMADGFLEWSEVFEGIRQEEVSLLKHFISDFNDFAPDALKAIFQLHQKIGKKKGLDHTDTNLHYSPNVTFLRGHFSLTMDIDGLVGLYYEHFSSNQKELMGELYVDVIDRCGGEILEDSNKRRSESWRKRNDWKKGLE